MATNLFRRKPFFNKTHFNNENISGKFQKPSNFIKSKKKFETIYHYFDTTTLHGWRYISDENRSLLERGFWLVTIIFTYCGCGVAISQLISQWTANSIVLTYEKNPSSVTDIPFPAVTICADDQIKNSVFPLAEKFNQNKNNLSENEKIKIAVAETLCNIKEGHVDFLDKEIFNSMLREAVSSFEETIDLITHLDNASRSLKNYTHLTLTEYGLCYTFNQLPLPYLLQKNYLNMLQEIRNMTKLNISASQVWNTRKGYSARLNHSFPYRVTLGGFETPIVFLMKTNTSEHQQKCTRGSKGFTIFIHSTVELPTHNHVVLHVESASEVNVYIKPLVLKIESDIVPWSPKDRGCYLTYENPLNYYKVYSQDNCEYECRAMKELEACGCVTFHLPRNTSTPICGPRKLDCLKRAYNIPIAEKDPKCICLPSCTFVDYEVSSQSRSFNIRERSIYNSLASHIAEDIQYTVLAFTYQVRFLYETKRHALQGLPEFIANVGGTLSLFLGFTFFSLFELVYHLTLRVFVNYWNRKKKHVDTR